MTTTKIKEKDVQKYRNLFELKTFSQDGGEIRKYVFKDESFKRGSKMDKPHKEISDVMHKLIDGLSMDFVYEQVVACLDWVLENCQDGGLDIDDSCDSMHESIDSNVDVYTSNLTGWLNENNNHVYYLTEALHEFGEGQDGFQLLASAQYMAIEEVWAGIINLIRED